MPVTLLRRCGPPAAILMSIGSLLVYRPTHVGGWWEAVFDWMHVPVFAVIALATLFLMPQKLPTLWRYGLAFVVALVLAVVTEALQILLQRSASVSDLQSDASGAFAALSAAFAMRQRILFRVVFLAIAACVIAYSTQPIAKVTAAYIARNNAFPVLFDGDAESNTLFLSVDGVYMQTGWSRDHGHLFTRFEISAGATPRLEFRNIVTDWSQYSSLRLDVSVPGIDPVEFTIRVHDKIHRKGNQPHSDRFNRLLQLTPGHNQIEIPLREIRTAPNARAMEMQWIEAIVLFSSPEDVVRVIDLFEIRLH